MVEAGYARHVGLSEVGTETIPPRARDAYDLRSPDRVLADLPRDRGRDPGGLSRARDRDHRLQRPIQGAAQRALVEGPADRTCGLPQPRTPVQRGEPRSQPRTRRGASQRGGG